MFKILRCKLGARKGARFLQGASNSVRLDIFGWKTKNLTHFTFRTNCETFYNMIVFGKAESTQTKGTAKSIKSNVHIYFVNLSFQII